jgi:plastocyanin
MARRAYVSAAVALWMLAAGCPAALGANQTVTAKSSPNNVFDPASVTITQGETVTWNNDGGNFHNVHFDDESFVMPMTPDTSMWSVFRTFMQPGTYTYYCEVHRAQGMTGTVVVNAPPPGGGGGGTPGPAPTPDTPPVSSLVSPSKQRVARLFVRASMNEAGTLAATAAVGVPGAAKVYRFKRVSKAVAANQSVKLRLRLSKSKLKRVRRALRTRKLRASITLTATDTTGKQTIRKRKVRLTR